MFIHPDITVEAVIDAIERDDYTGFCTECGYEVPDVEPDGREYPCSVCGADAVYGAEELLFMLQA